MKNKHTMLPKKVKEVIVMLGITGPMSRFSTS